ncbi:MAG: hypothetical protein Q8Q23_05930 [bacterium]|nr:hypothetical protein [bacterium]
MRGKIFALSIIVIFFSLFGIGLVSVAQSAPDTVSETCLGGNCTPLGHSVFHVYLVSGEQTDEVSVIVTKTLVSLFYNNKKITLIPITPPPNFFLNS